MALTKQDAREYASRYKIPLNRDFHALDSDTVARILDLARLVKYREPKNANGSKARCFHAFLKRRARRED